MRAVTLFVVLLLFIIILPQIYAETYIKLVSPETKTVCQVYGTWKLSFEITNTNPYTVFVAIPEAIGYYDKSLKYSKEFQKLDVKGIVATYIEEDNYTTLNGEKGIWIPPYSTVKVHKYGIFTYNLSTTVIPDRYKIVGPALMNVISVFDETLIEKPLYKYGVKVDNYKLLVNGKVVKSSDTEVISIVIPTPLILKDYDSFNKLLGRYDVDVWVDSYRKYVNKHKTMSSKRYPELHDSIDDTLVPIIDNDFVDMDMNLKPFDVPAMVFTTDDGESKPLEFSYVMYKY